MPFMSRHFSEYVYIMVYRRIFLLLTCISSLHHHSLFLHRRSLIFVIRYPLFVASPQIEICHFGMSTESVSGLDNGAHAGPIIPDLSGAVPISAEARAKRRIAALEDELQTMKEERGTKQRFVIYHLSVSKSSSLVLKERRLITSLKAGRFGAWLFCIPVWKI
jgi:hypothetical protein